MSRRDHFFDAGLVAALAAVILGVAILDPGRYVDFHKAYDSVAREILRTGSFHYSYPSLKNIPIVALLFVPLARFDRDASDVLFLAIELAAYVGAYALAVFALARDRREKLALLCLFATARPFYVSIELGQLTVPCFTLLVATLVALRRRRDGLAGGLTSLAFVLKVPAGFLVAWFLLRRRFKCAAAAGLTFTALLAVSLAWFGSDLHADYWDNVIVKTAGQTLPAHNNASLAATSMRLARAGQPEGRGDLHHWRMIEIPRAGNALLTAAGVGMLVWLGWTLWRRQPGGDDALALEFSMVICVALILLPVVWDHYFLFLVIPFFVTSRPLLGPGRNVAAVVAWAAAFGLANLPVPALVDVLEGMRPLRLLRAAIPAAPFVATLLLLALSTRQHGRLVES